MREGLGAFLNQGFFKQSFT